MKRMLMLALLVYFCGMATVTEARWGHRLKHTTAASAAAEPTAATATGAPATSTTPDSDDDEDASAPEEDEEEEDEVAEEEGEQEDNEALVVVVAEVDEKAQTHHVKVKDHHCAEHPAAVKRPRLIDQSDQRSVDGLYEYRYVLSNGDTRYERAYWKPLGQGRKVMARKGFYSYPLPNRNFLTVYYTADQNGFHQDSAKYSQTQPLLPRNLLVPGDPQAPTKNDGKKPKKPKRPLLKTHEGKDDEPKEDEHEEDKEKKKEQKEKEDMEENNHSLNSEEVVVKPAVAAAPTKNATVGQASEKIRKAVKSRNHQQQHEQQQQQQQHKPQKPPQQKP